VDSSPRAGTPGTARWRPLEVPDAAALAAMMYEVEATDREGRHLGVHEAAAWLAETGLDLANGSIAAFDADLLVAFATLRSKTTSGPVRDLAHAAAVRPAHRGRGFGSRLLEWMPTGARAVQEARRCAGRSVEVLAVCAMSNTDSAQLYRSFGFEPVRRLDRMLRRLDRPAHDVGPLDGVEIVPYSEDREDEARRAKNEAFRSHRRSVPSTPERWRRRALRRPEFQPSLSFLALEAESRAVVGVVIVHWHAAQTEATGLRDAYVSSISTLPSHRRRGVAAALLASVLDAARGQGFDTSSLHVDAASPDRAPELYQKAGYAVTGSLVSYALTVEGTNEP
jgi:mycothiol synthase